MAEDRHARIALLQAPELEPILARDAGLRVVSFRTMEALLEHARHMEPRLCAVGPGKSAKEVRERIATIRRQLPFTDVVVWFPRAQPQAVRAALLAGARDVLLDADADRAAARMRDVIDKQQLLPLVLSHGDRVRGRWQFEGLLSRNREMWNLFETVSRSATTGASVLILGETGTGKDLIARAIHRRSGRNGRYVAVNCGAIPETLIDSELFGHVEGAFTGARGRKEGLFRHADGGTLLLDELGSLPAEAQGRLLRVLQNGVVRPVGGEEEQAVDVRVLAATSTPLDTAVDNGSFREDLLYRLDVIRLIIPPLRERTEDVVLLFGHFVQELAAQYRCARPNVTDGFLDALMAYAWPGNVRELENFVERLIITHAGRRVGAEQFRKLTRSYRGRAAPAASVAKGAGAEAAARLAYDPGRTLQEFTATLQSDAERTYLEGLLEHTQGRVSIAAKRAGISRRTLHRKLERYGIDKRRFRA